MAPITKIEKNNNNLPKSKTVLSASDLLLIQNGGITYSDFLDMLEAVFTPGTSSGSGEVLDMGDRMTGNTIVNMGNRI